MKNILIPTVVVALACSMNASAGVDFEKEVLPVLEAKCMKCHRATYTDPKSGRAKKPKSGYRMDTAELMVGEGDENKANIIPGSATKSPAFVSTTLPEDDDYFMPPKGDPMTAQEQAKFKAWINEGAKFGNWKVTEFNPDGSKK